MLSEKSSTRSVNVNFTCSINDDADDVNDNEEWGVRGKLLFTPTDTVEINTTIYYSEIERRCCMAEQLRPNDPTWGIATPGFLAAQAAAGYPFTNFDDDDHRVDGDDEGDDTRTLSPATRTAPPYEHRRGTAVQSTSCQRHRIQSGRRTPRGTRPSRARKRHREEELQHHAIHGHLSAARRRGTCRPPVTAVLARARTRL